MLRLVITTACQQRPSQLHRILNKFTLPLVASSDLQLQVEQIIRSADLSQVLLQHDFDVMWLGSQSPGPLPPDSPSINLGWIWTFSCSSHRRCL